MLPLGGIRVLDLTRLLPGPYTTRVLAELGAEVIKIEPPDGGDYTRWTPPLSGDPPVSGAFAELNAGKKSVALDLKRPEAVAALRVLASRSDVLIEGFRPGVMTRLGLDPRELMEANPRLIYCAVTGFGLTGPDSLRAGHDLGYLARGGGLALTGPASAPTAMGIQVADVGASLTALSGILAALFARERTGKGSVVDVSLVESALPFGALAWGSLRAGGLPRRGEEILDGSRPCYSVYRTKDDRFLAVGALEPKFFEMFTRAIGLPELAMSGLDTGESGRAVKARVQERLLEKTRDEWAAVFREVDCCVEPVLELEEAEKDPHLVARGLKLADGSLRAPVRVSEWAGVGGGPFAALRPAAAMLGADTEQVLREAGVGADVLKALGFGAD